MTVVRNRAVDGLRRDAARARKNVAAEALEHVASDDDVAAEVVTRVGADDLRGVLGDLPAEQREVITLAYFGGLTHMQIATHLGLPCGTVKGRIRLGLEKVRDRIGPVASARSAGTSSTP